MANQPNDALDALVASVEGNNSEFQEREKVAYLEMKNEGKYKVRVLPRKDNPSKYPANRKFKHSGFTNPNTNKVSIFSCMGADCPLCAEYKRIEKSEPGAWRKKSQIAFDYYVQDANGNFKIMETTKALHEQIESEFLAKAKGERVNIFDLDNGHDIEITRKGTAKDTEWSVKVNPKSSRVDEDVRAAFQRAKPLEEIVWKNTPEELQMVVDGVAWRKPKQGQQSQSGPDTNQKSDPASSAKAAVAAKAKILPKVEEPQSEEPEMSDDLSGTDDEELQKMRREIFHTEEKE